jgi:phosphoribosylglycinamide formyltransferase 1
LNDSRLYNLVVALDDPFDVGSLDAIEIAPPASADERTLAWIDDVFGGSWSSEAYAGVSLVARRAGAPIGFVTIEPKGLTFSWLEALARAPGIGVVGPFGVEPGERGRGLGMLLLRLALNELRARGYTRALIPAVGDERLRAYYADAVGAQVGESFERASLHRPSRRTLVMASGNGSNFQAVLDASRRGELPIEIVGLISNDPRAYAIARARGAGMDSVQLVAWDRAGESRADYDARLLAAAQSPRPDLVLLLGWMHLLSESFVGAFPEMLNLHPAFLPLDPRCDDVIMPDGTGAPAFRGPHAVRDALAASSAWVGATLHGVTGATDRGPVLARKPLRVEPGEDEDHLMERVHEIERPVVRAGVIRWLYERSRR